MQAIYIKMEEILDSLTQWLNRTNPYSQFSFNLERFFKFQGNLRMKLNVIQFDKNVFNQLMEHDSLM